MGRRVGPNFAACKRFVPRKLFSISTQVMFPSGLNWGNVMFGQAPTSLRRYPNPSQYTKVAFGKRVRQVGISTAFLDKYYGLLPPR